MRNQTHHTVPINKGPAAFLGMGAIKSNSRRHGREVVNKFVLAFLLPYMGNDTQICPWYQEHPQKSLSISAQPCRSQASMIDGWYEDSSDLINRALGVKDGAGL